MNRNRLSRRTVLRGFGASACIGLPLLEAMIDGRGNWYGATSAQAATPAPVRFMFFHIPNGMSATSLEPFTPKGTGKGYPLSPTLRDLTDFRDKVNVLTGLRHTAYHLSPGMDEHAKCTGSLLTGFPVTLETASGRTLDHQLGDAWAAAGYTGKPTLNAICDASKPGIGADKPPIFNSWGAKFQRTAPIFDPFTYFKEIFGADAGLTTMVPGNTVGQRQSSRKAVLDFVKADAEALKAKLGSADRLRLDLHLTRIQELEQEVLAVPNDLPSTARTQAERDEYEALTAGPATNEVRVKAMVKLTALALQLDLSRVAILQYGWPFGNYVLPAEAGVMNKQGGGGNGDGDHGASHMTDDAYLPWVQYKVKTFRYLLELMDAAEEVGTPGGTLLGNSVTLGTSDVGLGSHNTERHGVMLAGTAGGKIATGMHQEFADKTPINNLMLKLVELIAVPGMTMPMFGIDGTSPLALATP
ncbi:MAG: hypothetical protein RJA70_313 [Pseudomonadota bacterium]|jgi:hypothetical protein